MKYDDASWHYGGNFPADLANEAGATHIGMFVAWGLLAGLAGDIHLQESAVGLKALRDRSITLGNFFLTYCDGKFTNEDLNDLGNSFAAVYYESEPSPYLQDYEKLFLTKRFLRSSLPSLYHVPDSWESFDRLRPVLDKRFATWRQAGG